MAFSRKRVGSRSKSRPDLRLTAGGKTDECATRLLRRLQTTLDIDAMLRTFSREISLALPHSSIAFRKPESDLEFVFGREARHECVFRLHLDNQDLGELRFTRGKPFDNAESDRLQILIAAIVYPLRNALLYFEAVRASLHDPLTGIYNRKYLDTALQREVGLARRHGTPLSVVMMDIDRFKAINDENGHDAGDRVLRTLVTSILSSLRDTDIFARYGGDELTVLLSNTPRRGALIVARNIAEGMAGLRIPIGENSIRPSASLGVATLLKRDRPERLLARADEALYRAKSTAPGRIGVASTRGVRVRQASELPVPSK